LSAIDGIEDSLMPASDSVAPFGRTSHDRLEIAMLPQGYRL